MPLPTGTCYVADCDRDVIARGMCPMHYKRWRKYGDPNTVAVILGDPVARFWSKVDKSPGGCWLWTGTIGAGGYGRFKINGKLALAHRVSYEMLVGPIPEGLTLDHGRARGCTHRRCVNPEHLEPVTGAVNTLRGDAVTAQHARKTACIHGHELTPANTYVSPQGGRRCRTCRTIERHRRREVKRAAS